MIVTVQHTHTHTHPFNGPLSETTRVSRYQRGKTNLDFTEATGSEWQWHQVMDLGANISYEWQWHQLGYMQLCTPLQTDNHADTHHSSSFTGRVPFLSPNQQSQSTEGSDSPTVAKNVVLGS